MNFFRLYYSTRSAEWKVKEFQQSWGRMSIITTNLLPEGKINKKGRMAEEPVDISFTSIQEFEKVYRLVRDEIFLFDPDSGEIIATNYSFAQSRAGEGIPLNIKELGAFPFSEDQSPGRASQEIEGAKEQGVLLVSSGKLGNRLVKAGFISKTTADSGVKQVSKAEKAEKDALLNEVYHRVKNNLNIIVSLLSLQINRISEPATRHMLLESKSRIYTLSLLQEKLYSSPRISEIKAGNYIHCLALSVISTFKPGDKGIQLIMEVEDEWLNIDTLVPLGLLTHELVSNSVIHAFSQTEQGIIKISFRLGKEERFEMTVADNGSGMREGPSAEAATTLGFQLVKSLAKQLKAEYNFNHPAEGGTSFSIVFKELQK